MWFEIAARRKLHHEDLSTGWTTWCETFCLHSWRGRNWQNTNVEGFDQNLSKPKEEASVHRPQPQGSHQWWAVWHHQSSHKRVEGWTLLQHHEGHSKPPWRWSKVDCSGWGHWSHVDRVPQHCHGWQQDSDPGQQWENCSHSWDEAPVWDIQPEDCHPCNCQQSRNPLHQPWGSWMESLCHKLDWDQGELYWEGKLDSPVWQVCAPAAGCDQQEVQEDHTNSKHLPHPASLLPAGGSHHSIQLPCRCSKGTLWDLLCVCMYLVLWISSLPWWSMWSPHGVLKVVHEWVQVNKVSCWGKCVWCVGWPHCYGVHNMEWQSSKVWAGLWSATAGLSGPQHWDNQDQIFLGHSCGFKLPCHAHWTSWMRKDTADKWET